MLWADDSEIGSIPVEYNYLVGYYHHTQEPTAIHFTDGGPWHPGYGDVEFGDRWLTYLSIDEKEKMDKEIRDYYV